ncbi:MAG TPA: helix-turn-helix transcriptional regulator [Acidimicrobiales bacterium]
MRDGFEARLDDLGQFIRAQREVAKMSVRRLAELAGVSNPYLSQIERGLRRPSADILQQIAKALRISTETLYIRAGILDGDDHVHDDPDVVRAIRHDGRLTPDQKHTLLTVYESFVRDIPAPSSGADDATDPVEAESTLPKER